jgi:hypothetical protein
MEGLELVNLLPESWRQVAVIITQVVVAASALVALAKTALGKPSANDPKWKKAVFAVLQALDFVAMNSETITAKKKRAKAEAVVNSLAAMPNDEDVVDDDDKTAIHVNHYRGEPK